MELQTESYCSNCVKHSVMSISKTLAANYQSCSDKWVHTSTNEKTRQKNGLEIIRGVREALQYLVAAGVKVGLVTGNVESIAWGKMQAVGLEAPEFFSEPRFGGFGTDVRTSGTDDEAKVRDRGDQITIAMFKALDESACKPDIEEPLAKRICKDVPVRRFHIGDAPSDVLAAAYAGVTPIGVATGKFTAKELQDACPAAHVLESLEDLEKFIHILGLEPALLGK